MIWWARAEKSRRISDDWLMALIETCTMRIPPLRKTELWGSMVSWCGLGSWFGGVSLEGFHVEGSLVVWFSSPFLLGKSNFSLAGKRRKYLGVRFGSWGRWFSEWEQRNREEYLMTDWWLWLNHARWRSHRCERLSFEDPWYLNAVLGLGSAEFPLRVFTWKARWWSDFPFLFCWVKAILA